VRLKKLLSASGANAVSQGAAIAIQLVSVPAFLTVWSPEEYGVWLMLSSIPSYLLLADAGVVPVAINKVSALAASERHEEATVTFQSAILFCAMVGLALTALASLFLLVAAMWGARQRSMPSLLSCLLLSYR